MADRDSGAAEVRRAAVARAGTAIRRDRALRSFGGLPETSGADRAIVGDSSTTFGVSTRRNDFTAAGIVTAPRKRAHTGAAGQTAGAAGADDVSSGADTSAATAAAGRASGCRMAATGAATTENRSGVS